MPAERAGYTVHMFVVDVSRSMGNPHMLELADGSIQEITNLEWALKYVKLKIQDMIYNARKTDKCGVIIFGTEETKNLVNDRHGGYDNVVEYIPICTPNAGTLAKLDRLQPSSTYGDPIDGLIVATETQQEELQKKKTWSRKVSLITDGQNIIELEDWEATANKLSILDVSFLVIGVDFDSDDPEYEYQEPEKSNIKSHNEKFWHEFVSKVEGANIGTLGLAILDISKPFIKEVRTVPMASVLRIGDVEGNPDQAIEISVTTTKCTAISRPKSFKKFAVRVKEGTKDEEEIHIDPDGTRKVIYAQLKAQSYYYIDPDQEDEEADDEDDDKEKTMKKEVDEEGDTDMAEEDEEKDKSYQVEKENLIRGFKYGTAYVPCPDGSFPRLETKKGIDIIGFFDAKKFRRELSMSEIQYVWGDKDSPLQQVALSSIARGMATKGVMAIARWITRDGMDAKMGVLSPCLFEKVDCLLWAQMPFADDVRKYTFPSLERLVTKTGKVLTEHPCLPTEEQCEAMDNFVEAMDLMRADKDPETGKHIEWHTPIQSYNPALHRVKQAMFHCSVVNDLVTDPLDPPHPDLLKYFEPPKKVLKRSRDAVDDLVNKLKVKEIVKKPKKARKDEHAHAANEDEEPLLLAPKPSSLFQSQLSIKDEDHSGTAAESTSSSAKPKPELKVKKEDDGSETEDDSDDDLQGPQAIKAAPSKASTSNSNPLPTPARSLSPRAHSISQSGLQNPSMDVDTDIDPQRDPDRVVGRTKPLEDFRKTIQDPSSVPSTKVKAIKDIGDVILGIALAPFASRREEELKDCLKEMRRAALEEDEIDLWNEFIQNLKDECLFSAPGNKEFWSAVKRTGRGLITSTEARRLGAKSDVGDDQALEFLK
ncbi:SPOC domain-like protein [Dendrothele bispora CBS 962.96]|uniref:ATP-dependent DNA helicase II subunit 2 n=1 Tax=Dendrothele bispora (strain CBS 962.96) TaxID=1314807 RepID=A0A4S8LFJ3_DENBC|nr:SPOC domain-like protein [Dendrothele bispora CBS 962.96]